MFFSYLKISLTITTMIWATGCYAGDVSLDDENSWEMEPLLINSEKNLISRKSTRQEQQSVLSEREKLINKFCNGLINTEGRKHLNLNEMIPHNDFKKYNDKELMVFYALRSENEPLPAGYHTEVVNRVQKNVPAAQYISGLMHEKGEVVEKDDKKAAELIEMSAINGYAPAQYRFGWKYNGQGRQKDETVAFWWVKESAQQDYAPAQDSLGLRYANGIGVEQDDKEAVSWFIKSATEGYDSSQYNLGVMYRDGRGVKKSNKKAFSWYEKSAHQGYAPAQYSLGSMYANGEGVAKDDKMAVSWIEKSALQGYAPAQAELGVRYVNGKGVQKDDKVAISLFEKSAAQGSARAQHNLGVMYLDGQGVPKDYKMAFSWVEKSALQGFVAAQDIFQSTLKCKDTVQFSETLNQRYAEDRKGLQDSIQSLQDYYLNKEAFANLSGLNDTLAVNPTLAQDCRDIVQHLTPYQEILNQQLLAPGYLINGLDIQENKEYQVLFTQLITSLPGSNDDYISFLSLDSLKTTTEEKLKLTIINLWEKTTNTLNLMKHAGLNSEKLGKNLEVLKITNHPSFDFMAAVTKQYLNTKTEEDYNKAIGFLNEFLKDINKHRKFAIRLNERLYRLLGNTAPYRNHLSKQKYAFLYQ